MAAGAPDDVDTYRRHAGELIRYATALVGPCGTLDQLPRTDSFVWSAEPWVEGAPAPTLIAADGTASALEGGTATFGPAGQP